MKKGFRRAIISIQIEMRARRYETLPLGSKTKKSNSTGGKEKRGPLKFCIKGREGGKGKKKTKERGSRK